MNKYINSQSDFFLTQQVSAIRTVVQTTMEYCASQIIQNLREKSESAEGRKDIEEKTGVKLPETQEEWEELIACAGDYLSGNNVHNDVIRRNTTKLLKILKALKNQEKNNGTIPVNETLRKTLHMMLGIRETKKTEPARVTDTKTETTVEVEVIDETEPTTEGKTTDEVEITTVPDTKAEIEEETIEETEMENGEEEKSNGILGKIKSFLQRLSPKAKRKALPEPKKQEAEDLRARIKVDVPGSGAVLRTTETRSTPDISKDEGRQ